MAVLLNLLSIVLRVCYVYLVLSVALHPTAPNPIAFWVTFLFFISLAFVPLKFLLSSPLSYVAPTYFFIVVFYLTSKWCC